MRGEIIFVTAKRRWPPLKLDNDRSEESTTFWTRISRVTMSLSIYVFSNIAKISEFRSTCNPFEKA